MTHFLEVALEAADISEKIVAKYFDQNPSTEIKADNTPVTIADKEVESAIRSHIGSVFPDHSFLGEEFGASELDSDYVWIIDPIDGTKNFARGIPLFSTEIALMYKGELILGISNMPAMQRRMYAEKGSGAFLNGKMVSVSEISNIEETTLSFGNLKYFTQGNYTHSLLKLSEQCRGFRGFGDCYTYQLLACGNIDIAVDIGCKIWDIAACSVIMQEAGAVVTDISGNKISIESTSILASNKNLHPLILDYFNRSDALKFFDP